MDQHKKQFLHFCLFRFRLNIDETVDLTITYFRQQAPCEFLSGDQQLAKTKNVFSLLAVEDKLGKPVFESDCAAHNF